MKTVAEQDLGDAFGAFVDGSHPSAELEGDSTCLDTPSEFAPDERSQGALERMVVGLDDGDPAAELRRCSGHLATDEAPAHGEPALRV